MGKLPWMKFFPADWKHDTRCLTPHTRGVWIDLLCTLWPDGTKTFPRSNWLRELSVTEDEFTSALQEIQAFSIADIHECNGAVTVSSRRIQRDSTAREHTRKRVDKLRRNANVTRSVTVKKRVEARSQKSEVRDQKLEVRGQKLETRSQKEDEEVKTSGTVQDSVPMVNGVETWKAYSDAYRGRYHVDPVRNQQTNSHLKNLVKRIGGDESPALAIFFLTHNDPFYVKSRHPTSLLLRDCEGLHTQWATGIKATTGEARSIEKQDDAREQVKRVEAMLKGGL